MKNISFLLFLLSTVSSQAQQSQQFDIAELFTESLKNLERNFSSSFGCQYRNEDGEIIISSDDEVACNRVKSLAKKSFSRFKDLIKDATDENLETLRERYEYLCPSLLSTSPEGVSSGPTIVQPGRWSWTSDYDYLRPEIDWKRKTLSCEVFSADVIGVNIEPDTGQVLCCKGEVSVIVKTRDFDQYEVVGSLGAAVELSQGEDFRVEFGVKAETQYDPSSGQDDGRGAFMFDLGFSR